MNTETEIDLLSKSTSYEQVDNLIKKIQELKIFANQNNYIVKEIDYDLRTRYWIRRLSAKPWDTVLPEPLDLQFTPPEITIFWIKVHLHYLM